MERRLINTKAAGANPATIRATLRADLKLVADISAPSTSHTAPSTTRTQVEVFGFHLAGLDLRRVR
jgi:phosphoenolpyruvate carboxylase